MTQYAPNVSLEPVGIFQNSASFYIRGQGTADIESATDPKVSIFIDGVYQARVSTALSDFVQGGDKTSHWSAGVVLSVAA